MTSVSSYSLSQPLPVGAKPEWVHARFDRAVDIVQSLPRSGPIQTNYEDKLMLYSMYKQATEGDIQSSRPGLLDVLGRAKWDAWNKRKGMSPEEAERMYVHALLRILKGFSDRPQAVELIRELETFSLDPRGIASSGSFVEEDSEDETSTEGDRRMPQASTSRARNRPAASQRAQPPSGHKVRPARRTQGGPPASSVAPSLPGYGPPRTRADSLRRVDSSDEDDSDAYSSADDGQRIRRMPSASGFSQRSQQLQPPFQQQQQQQQQQGRSGGRLPVSPQQYAFPQAQLHQPDRVMSPPLQPAPFSPQQPASSSTYFHPDPSAMLPPMTPGSFQSAMSPSMQPTLNVPPQNRPIPSASGSTGFAHSSSAAVGSNNPSTSATPAAATPGANRALDAALDRIQTSLTALHERLTEVERSKLTLSTTSGASRHGKTSLTGNAVGSGGGRVGSPTGTLTADSPWTVLQALTLRLMILFKLRDPDTTSRTVLRISWTRLLLKLFAGVLSVGRRVLGDLAIVIVVAGALGRVTGTSEGVGQVLLRVLKALSSNGGAIGGERRAIRAVGQT
ncbi:hypothetical protein ACM66B_003168 [Microbotryomycetes sp. NB124-2]